MGEQQTLSVSPGNSGTNFVHTGGRTDVTYNNGFIYTPSQIPIPMETKPDSIRQLSIRQLNKGYIVTVGCHEFAITDSKTLIKKLSEYIKDPQITEEKWFKGELF